MKTVLIVDDEIDIQSSLSFALKDEGYEILTTGSPAEALELLNKNAVDIGLFDVWFPDGDGIDLLEKVRKHFSDVICIMMSGHGNIELALKSIRLGAYDFLEKPLELEKVLVLLRNSAEALDLRKENSRLSIELKKKTPLIGDSAPMKHLRQLVEKAAAAHSHVLVLGENGSGKELIARELHHSSPQSNHPFVAINCAAIPENLFEIELFGHEKGAFTGANQRQQGRLEQAGLGTLFLDEISELSLNAQGKLLRVLEEKKFERVGGRLMLPLRSRIVAASNRDLTQSVREGRFREDLFFRLNVLPLTVPPLRERTADIAPLAQHFLTHIAQDNGRGVPTLHKELTDWLVKYEWPGNVRELRNLIERMIIMGNEQTELGLSDLPEELQAFSVAATAPDFISVDTTQAPLRNLRAEFETMVLAQRLKLFSGNVTKTAESLGIERAHLHRKLKQYGLGSSNPSMERPKL